MKSSFFHKTGLSTSGLKKTQTLMLKVQITILNTKGKIVSET